MARAVFLDAPTPVAAPLLEFGSAVGAPARLIELCERRQTKFLRGMRAARQVFRACG